MAEEAPVEGPVAPLEDLAAEAAQSTCLATLIVEEELEKELKRNEKQEYHECIVVE